MFCRHTRDVSCCTITKPYYCPYRVASFLFLQMHQCWFVPLSVHCFRCTTSLVDRFLCLGQLRCFRFFFKSTLDCWLVRVKKYIFSSTLVMLRFYVPCTMWRMKKACLAFACCLLKGALQNISEESDVLYLVSRRIYTRSSGNIQQGFWTHWQLFWKRILRWAESVNWYSNQQMRKAEEWVSSASPSLICDAGPLEHWHECQQSNKCMLAACLRDFAESVLSISPRDIEFPHGLKWTARISGTVSDL